MLRFNIKHYYLWDQGWCTQSDVNASIPSTLSWVGYIRDMTPFEIEENSHLAHHTI